MLRESLTRKSRTTVVKMRHKLSLTPDEDEELVATVYGIISDLPDYRLTFMINQALALRLRRSEEDRKLYHKVGLLEFSEFTYYEEMRLLNWRLSANNRGVLKNKAGGSGEPSAIPLVASLRSINYFLWYDDVKNAELHKHIFEVLKPNPYIRVIQEIVVSDTKNIENLISEY